MDKQECAVLMPVWSSDAGKYLNVFVCVHVFPINLACVLLARQVCVLEVGQKQRSKGNRQHMDQGLSTKLKPE